MSQFKEADSAAKLWFILSMIWFPIFTSIGFIVAVKFFQPTFLTDIPWLTFGRIRPSHVNGVLFGFVSSGLIGSMFYIIPRLTNSPLQSPKLIKFIAVAWNLAVAVGIFLVMEGNTQGREYAELPWVIDVAVMACLILMGYSVFSTIIKRKEKKLYASLWYFSGIFLWFPVVYFIGNVMWNPPSGAVSGVLDGILNWYYGHNVLGLWFTPFGTAIWYYAIPRLVKRPLYSQKVSLIAFFSLAFFYTGVGAHHLLQGPIPEWLKTVAVVNSGLMLIPVLAFVTNVGMTFRGLWRSVYESVPLRFMAAGAIMYILGSIQGSFQAFRTVNVYTHYSQWTVGHAHINLLGGFGFLAIGMIYWLVPEITGKPLYSKKLMSLSWWLAMGGFILFFAFMTLAGLVANAPWAIHLSVAITLPMLEPYFIGRALSGGIVVTAAYVFAYNIIMTFLSKPRLNIKETVEVKQRGKSE